MHRRRIDGHVHLIPKREPGWIDPITQYRHDAYGMLRTPLGDRRRLPPYMADPAFEAGTRMEVVEEYGVEKAVLMARLESGVPEAALDAVKRYPGRIAGAVCVEIRREGEAQLQEWHSRGIGIVKFEMRGLNELYGKLESGGARYDRGDRSGAGGISQLQPGTDFYGAPYISGAKACDLSHGTALLRAAGTCRAV